MKEKRGKQTSKESTITSLCSRPWSHVTRTPLACIKAQHQMLHPSQVWEGKTDFLTNWGYRLNDILILTGWRQGWHFRSMPLYPCTRVVMWYWGLTSWHHAYLVSTLLSISSPLFMRQTDRQGQRYREGDRRRERQRLEFCLMWSCLSSAQCHIYKAGWAMSFQAFILLSWPLIMPKEHRG